MGAKFFLVVSKRVAAFLFSPGPPRADPLRLYCLGQGWSLISLDPTAARIKLSYPANERWPDGRNIALGFILC